MYMLVRRWLYVDASSPWRPVTPLSVGPPPLRPRRSCSPGAPSGDRRGFGTVPSLLREARACSATPIAATLPSADLCPVLVRWSWKHPISSTGLSLYSCTGFSLGRSGLLCRAFLLRPDHQHGAVGMPHNR